MPVYGTLYVQAYDVIYRYAGGGNGRCTENGT
jgi:hypothetical protein